MIRGSGGYYSGHLLHKGKQYVLVPIKRGVSVLYERSGDFSCGISEAKEAKK
jgi:hypothetical protein